MRARLPSASLTWKYSPKTPSLKLENFQPESMPPECMGYPDCVSVEDQSGVMAGIKTWSPGLKSLTSAPTSTTSPHASWPRIMSVRSPIAPSQHVCTSEVHGATAKGRTIASRGPQTGRSFSTQPIRPMERIAKPFIVISFPSSSTTCGRRTGQRLLAAHQLNNEYHVMEEENEIAHNAGVSGWRPRHARTHVAQRRPKKAKKVRLPLASVSEPGFIPAE